MGKFIAVEDAIFSIFATADWSGAGLKTVPTNYEAPEDSGEEFIRVNVISNGNGVNKVSVSGMLIVDIFTSAGKGPRPATAIADKLESFVAYKSVPTSSGVAQFQGGVCVPKGVDSVNPLLFRSSYSIPFNFYGVA